MLQGVAGALDVDSLRWWVVRASDTDAANDSAQCNQAVEGILAEVKGHVDTLKAHPMRRDVAERLDASSVFLWDEGHFDTAQRASALADQLVPGIVSKANKAKLGRK
jgi:hypothetical protein